MSQFLSFAFLDVLQSLHFAFYHFMLIDLHSVTDYIKFLIIVSVLMMCVYNSEQDELSAAVGALPDCW